MKANLVADLYIRVSTDEQAEKGYSLRQQEESLRRYCETKGYTIRNVISEDYSAKTFKRPAWRQLWWILKNRSKVNLLLFTKWDRFSRNAGDSYQMISRLRRLGSIPKRLSSRWIFPFLRAK
ncbi:recombinase family protein [Chitinophaga sedimenti]|uniref:recombinase family protein n=1 Tax=Chitinophaga sedimenti TaxID=2033606 RepID=UPI0020035B13|nr:recombinase family protein [Chitinophaga sedimenti]MCK7559484.1 recombinase family protein [Chitinophaga sedimenti]